MFCRSLFVLFLLAIVLSIFDLRLLLTSLISSSFSSSSIHNNCFRTLITVFAMISSLTYTQVIRWVVITIAELALNNNHSLTQSKLNQKYELSPLFYCLYKMTDYLSCSSFLQWIRRCVPLVKQKLYTVPESLVSHQIYSGNLIVHFAQVHVYTVLVSCCIAGKGNYVYFVFTPIWAVRIHVFYVIYLSCTNSCFLCYLHYLRMLMFSANYISYDVPVLSK